MVAKSFWESAKMFVYIHQKSHMRDFRGLYQQKLAELLPALRLFDIHSSQDELHGNGALRL